MGAKWTYTLLALFAFVCVKAQVNLVPNGSFEDIIICPDFTSQFSGYTAQWHSANSGTPDLYSYCATPNEYCGIPNSYNENLIPIDGECLSGFFYI